MPYTRDIGKEFWFDFDNQTLWQRTPAVTGAIVRGYGALGPSIDLDIPPDAFRSSFAESNHPVPFLTRMQPGKVGLIDLSDILLGIIDAHLTDDEAIRSAFEDFGQGVLFDDRRPDGFKIHKMDGDPTDWVGYQRWNAYMRAMQLFGYKPDRWLFLNRCLALAWAIQTKVAPTDDVPGTGMDAAELIHYRTVWMSQPLSRLDWAFGTHRFQAPSLTEIQSSPPATPLTGFAKVQEILTQAVSTGNPRHSGQKKFWLKPYAEFMAMPPIYGHKLIADPGPTRGAESALIKALKGTLTPFPRMPLNNPPVPDDQIAWIQDWIDRGCPET